MNRSKFDKYINKALAGVMSAVLAAGMIPAMGQVVLADDVDDQEVVSPEEETTDPAADGEAEAVLTPGEEQTEPDKKDTKNAATDQNESDINKDIIYVAESNKLILRGEVDSNWQQLPDFADILDEIKYVETEDGTKICDGSEFFRDLDALLEVDLTLADMSDNTSAKGMFQRCEKLEEVLIDIDADTSKLEDMSEMFEACISLKTIDLTSFDTSKVTDTHNMFYACDILETVYVGNGWDMSNVTSSDNMFKGCSNIKGDHGTTYSSSHLDKEYARADYPGVPGYLVFNGFKFEGDRLLLSGELIAKIYISVPRDYDMNKTKMTLKVGKDKAFVSGGPDGIDPLFGYYYYYCPVTSVQLADTIKATLEYGEDLGGKLEFETDMESYLEGVARPSSSASDLAKALLKYGYYAQQYFSRVNGWTIGEDHKAMKEWKYDDGSAEIARVIGKVSVPVIGEMFENAFSIKANLALKDNIRMTFIFTAKDKKNYNLQYEDDSYLEADGHVYTGTFDGIMQTQLDEARVVKCADDTFRMTVNNYIAIVLNSYKNSEDNRDYCMLACSLYDVGVEASEYDG